MAPSVTKFRFQNSLDMVAARSMRDADSTARAGTGNAWCIVDSPTLGRMPSVSKRFPAQQTEQPVASISRLAMQAVNVAPLNIVKKNRRKGLVSSVQLVLPPSAPPSPPLFPGSADPSPISTPQSALAFTAEWDLGQKTFVLTPLDSPSSRTAASPSHISNAIPVNVEDDLRPISISLSTPSLYSPSILSRHPDLPVLQHATSPRSEVPIIDLTVDEDADYSPSCAGTPVSSIFDREPGYSHSRNFSQSTAASSMYELHSRHEKDNEEANADEIREESRSFLSGEDADEDDEHLRTDSVRAQIRGAKQDSWGSPRSDAQAYRQEIVQEASVHRLRKPLPDLPYTLPSDRYDRAVSQLDLSTTGKSFRRQLGAQISRAFSNSALFKRSAHGQ